MKRASAVAFAARHFREPKELTDTESPVRRFQRRVFNRDVMRQMLPDDVYLNVTRAMDGLEKIKPEYADTVAIAMKEWAISLGATHYCHWFQPLTGATAEKHDSFLDWADGPKGVLERFDGKQLIQGEPDASSFPSGGLRSTYEARGYTGWDPTSPAFVWKGGDGMTLCVPSIFFSWTGAVLDTKIPLHRSDEKMSAAVMRLLKHTGTKADRVNSNVGWEQEYFVVDRALRSARPDLVLLGKTVFGAPPPKGQELEDHYFGAVKNRILCFMQDLENEALELGVPIKTRHNEVAPAQHEMAPYFEKASLSVDHNILTMELMRQIAIKHELACLLHEKPFAGVNGSGKHVNWSLSTDSGLNLLDPAKSEHNSLQFLMVLTAILDGVHRHADILRASIASRSNDFRLGAHEAPPAIISVYLGEELEALLEAIEEGRPQQAPKGSAGYNLGIPMIPELPKDYTDRNRTSPLAFTGNKFEYRAVGSLASCAVPVTVLNLLVAESLNEMVDEIEAVMAKEKSDFAKAALPVLEKVLKRSKPIRFLGNNYSKEWAVEAQERGLPNLATSMEAFSAYKTDKAKKLFNGVLEPHELDSRYEIAVDTYAKTVHIEASLSLELFYTQVVPGVTRYHNELFQAIVLRQERAPSPLARHLERFGLMLDKGVEIAGHIEQLLEQASLVEGETRAIAYCKKVSPAMLQLRQIVDQLEQLCDDEKWPLPKYRELLFLV